MLSPWRPYSDLVLCSELGGNGVENVLSSVKCPSNTILLNKSKKSHNQNLVNYGYRHEMIYCFLLTSTLYYLFAKLKQAKN